MKRIKFLFAWYDFWIGIFIDSKKRKIYLFPFPMFGIVIDLIPENIIIEKVGDVYIIFNRNKPDKPHYYVSSIGLFSFFKVIVAANRI